MALPSCDPWPANTVRFSDQIAACRENSGGAAANELPDIIFLLTVIDALQRLAVKGVTGFLNLTNYQACEGEKNAHAAYQRLVELSPPIQANGAELKQQVLWQLANALCGNAA